MTFPTTPHHYRLQHVAAAVLLSGVVGFAHAFTTTITPSNTKTIFLRVGDGGAAVFCRNQSCSSTQNPGVSSTVNVVSVSVPAAQVGDGSVQAMTTNATQATSSYDRYAFCNLPGEIYIGGFYRYNTSGTAVLSVESSTPLSDGASNTIPFPQISWTSSGIGDTGAQPIPAGTFNGGTQTLASFPVNVWQESCHSFSYANASVPAAGTYTGRVTYTLTSP